ncbi:MAG: hypothetical protein QM796_15270 [Chthoniobacteraceae bacterium]
MRRWALQRGWTLNEYALGPVENSKVPVQPIPTIYEERDLYRAMICDFVSSSCAKIAASSRPPRTIRCPIWWSWKTCAALFTTTPPPAMDATRWRKWRMPHAISASAISASLITARTPFRPTA